jgi:hypothetical protein
MENLYAMELKKSFNLQILLLSKTIESLTARLSLLEDLIIDAGLADKVGAK